MESFLWLCLSRMDYRKLYISVRNDYVDRRVENIIAYVDRRVAGITL